MNKGHAALCSSPRWARHIADVVLPQVLADVTLGDQVLEIGPGYGASTAQLARDGVQLTAVEVDDALATDLAERFPQVEVVRGDGTDLPFRAGRFSAVVCCTMLHHVPCEADQDALFAQACRVLEPGGVFAGSDSIGGPGLRGFHRADTYVPVNPATLPARLERAGFAYVRVQVTSPGGHFVFTARSPGGRPTGSATAARPRAVLDPEHRPTKNGAGHDPALSRAADRPRARATDDPGAAAGR